MWFSWIASHKAAPDLDVAPDGAWFVDAQDDPSQSDLMLVENFR